MGFKKVGIGIAASLLIFTVSAFGEQLGSISHSLDDAVTNASTPKAVAELMRREFKFQDDESLFHQSDHWQSPEEFWRRKAGDCEDFALFAQYVLEQHHIEAYVINVYGPLGHAHTVTVFIEDGRYNVIDQDKLRHYKTKTLEAALSRVYPDWIWAARAQMKYAQGFPIEKIYNPSPSSQAKFKSSLQRTI